MSKVQGFAANLMNSASQGYVQKEHEQNINDKKPMSIFQGRQNVLSEIVHDKKLFKSQELVEPKRCKMWAFHNRVYNALTKENCADLIESIKAQGKQETPAIVRRLKNDPDGYEFEVICGARRHWSVTWLNEHNYPEIKFLIEVRELTDEEAFRLSDLENRARKDISDFERAKDYLNALAIHYGGHQKDMAERMNVDESWLSRYLDLARLPKEIMEAFVSPFEIMRNYVVRLKPYLKKEETADAMYKCAYQIKEKRQADREYLLDPKAVLKELILSAERSTVGRKFKDIPHPSQSSSLFLPNGKETFRIDRKSRKKLGITFLLPEISTSEDIDETLALLGNILRDKS